MASFDPARAYNDLPLLPPQVDMESRAVLKACIEARAAVAELKQAARLLPNQDVLINTIPLLEARASSEIENIVTRIDGANDEVVLVEVDPDIRHRRVREAGTF